jgi:putative hydrolase of the HAD superfamily
MLDDVKVRWAPLAAERHHVRRKLQEAPLDIRAVLFDADGVIQRPSTQRREAWQSLLGPGRSVDDFFGSVLLAERPAWLGASDFRESFSRLLCEWRCVGTLDEALVAWTMIEPDRDMLAAVAALRQRGIECHLATNQEPVRAAHMSEQLGYSHLFDREFYSCRLGFAKPDPEYFRAMLARLALPPGAVLFLDDKEANVAAARAVGLHAEHCLVEAGPSGLERILAGYKLSVA